MSDITYPVVAGSLPAGACATTYQELADLLASIYSVSISTNNTGIYVSTTAPADTTLVWKQLDASSLRPIRDYVYVSGLWLSRHTLEPGSIMLWGEALPDFTTFDGGDANALSVISGPMWEEATELRARFPLGVGTFPSGTAVAVGDTGGEETHILTSNELAKHQHPCWPTDGGDGNVGMLWSHLDPGGESCTSSLEKIIQPSDSCPTQTQLLARDQTDGGAGHNTVPPYYGVYFLRRTTRQFFAVP